MNKDRWEYLLEFQRNGLTSVNHSSLSIQAIIEIYDKHIKPKPQRECFKNIGSIKSNESDVQDKPRVKRIKFHTNNQLFANVNNQNSFPNAKKVTECNVLPNKEKKLEGKKVTFKEAADTFIYDAQPKFQKKPVSWP